jgi:FixJ family two-component response regulator
MQAPLIVCIDDDASVRDAVKGLLLAFDYHVEVCASAEEFLEIIPLDQVSCLIADLRLGGMSGLDLHRHLTSCGRHIPTILISAYLDDTTRSQAMAEGITRVFRKPVPPDKLLSCITAVLGQDSKGPAPA